MEQHTQGRVIKFRAWDGKQIVEDAAFLRGDGDAELAAFDDNSQVIWLQFTGLTDKNGKGIYEGDVLQDVEDDSTYVYELVWSGSGLTIRSKGSPAAVSFLLDPQFAAKLEVIGNIYENPELLK